MENSNMGIALVKELCPVCCKPADEYIILNEDFTNEKRNAEINALHNKAIAFADHLCKECAKLLEDVIYVIGIDIDKSGSSIQDLYRTGHILGIKRDSDIGKLFDKSGKIIELKDHSKIAFIDTKTGKEIFKDLWK